MDSRRKFILIILDGWGFGNHTKSDAIYQAAPPNMNSLMASYPTSRLLTCGENVGLPDGQMGNSEVGHLNIGAGRIVYQDLVKIDKACQDNSISKNKVLNEALQYAKENNKPVHLIGLVSDGGVHSSLDHLYKLCDVASEQGLSNVFIHALMDGRDTDPRSGVGFLKDLQQHLSHSTGKIASICGRYYTMDRDKRWERVKLGYDLLVRGKGEKFRDPIEAINSSYEKGVTDEFVKPIVMVDEHDQPLTRIQDGDVVICFNFRTDRLREITVALTQRDLLEFGMEKLNLHYVTMTNYDDTFQNVGVIFEKDNVDMTLGELLSVSGKKQLRIAETEKYPHVTFFFSGGREEVFPGEERIMIPSPKVATYDLQPEMSAYIVRDAVVAELRKQKFDFICLNFANGDMVGHTGVYPSILKAVRSVDECVGEVIAAAKENDYEALIIADHGNADYAINDDGSPNTAHSLNPVPSILVSERYKHIREGVLADVAPTILKIMEMNIPAEMTGKSLV